MGINFNAMYYCINPEHAEVLGVDEGLEEYSGREKEVSDWIKAVLQIADVLEVPTLKAMAQGFILGYTMRGYDSLLDFHLEDEEVVSTILKTYLANTKTTKKDGIAELVAMLEGGSDE